MSWSRGGGGGDGTPSAAAEGVTGEPLRPGVTLELGGTAYELVRLLGRGGMAEVFLARRRGAGGFTQEVAIKVLHEDLEEDDRFQKMFAYEAQLASRLRHPAIPKAYDLHRVGGRHYLVMEYVAGVSVRSVLRAVRGQGVSLSEGFCCYVAAGVADALDYAHGARDEGRPLGIVHRDVGAANVMIAETGDVKLLDFGIAYARLQGRERTQTGLQKGTPLYMSPEQVLGLPLDGRSDLFAAGLLLVELLTGQRVFEAETDLLTVRRIGECERGDVAASTREVPAGLRAICEQALQKRREDRFQSGAALARVLREYLVARGVLYVAADCAGEVQRLLSGSGGPEPSEREQAGTGVATGLELGSQIVSDVARTLFAEEEGRKRRSPARWLVVAVAGMLGVGASLGALLWQRERRPVFAGVMASPTEEFLQSLALAELVAQQEARPEPGPVILQGPVVRPKKRHERVAADLPVAGGGERKTEVSGGEEKRAVVPTGTLPRGTLVPGKLVTRIDATVGGPCEAVVTEDVVAGAITIPRGSRLICRARPMSDGRIGVGCDEIRGTGRNWAFRGLVVGEGQRVGLRVVDGEVLAGASFVVHVSASAVR